MNSNITRLFVYGTLRRGFHNPAYKYISKHFVEVGEAQVKGKLYDLGEYPGAVATDEESFVKGELYELKEAGEFEWVIEQLDDYEGLNPEEGEAPLYKRQSVEVRFNDQRFQAWIYWYNGNISENALIPSGDYFDSITTKST
ncbi:gamma-glutamylcyclotransferase family protein [Segetibacter aerophilus]|uniref:Gamma-glutamylcyclotransferase n=1 Tax=Segetibacter aerophilus TaxID=670293 RepID=A0A512BJ07_9BACT|nr:gamma-glutamylcyclotransferase family protein [Segetibacter aerophilus]GEO11956.1 gamma-glutamylcyclotransferase [Segetibacter aerophilus]